MSLAYEVSMTSGVDSVIARAKGPLPQGQAAGNPILQSMESDKERQERIEKNGQLTPRGEEDGTIW